MLRTLGKTVAAVSWGAILLLAVSCGHDKATAPDTEGPTQIIDFTANPGGDGDVLLTWSAPSDDGHAAVEYDLRYAMDSLNGTNWDLALRPDSLPDPGPPGTTDSLDIAGLPLLSRWAFAIRSRDAAGNWSKVSPVAVIWVPAPREEALAAAASVPVWSPDGGSIAFIRQASADPGGLIRLDLASGEETMLLQHEQIDSPVWSPDGTRIACGVGLAGGELQIWVVPAGGGTPVVVASEGANLNPQWSPDGGRIYFRSDRSGSVDIWSVTADGSDPRPISDKGPVESFDLSPDGTAIVFAATPYGASDLWTVASSGGFAFSLVSGTGIRSLPSWSPNGERIAFVVGEDGATEVETVAWSGGPSEPLAAVPFAGRPRWAPQGQRIALTGVQGDQGHLYLIEVARSVSTQVDHESGAVGIPSWSPDGTWIAYTTWPHSGESEIDRIRVQ